MSYSEKDVRSASVAVVPTVANYPYKIYCDLDGVMSDLELMMNKLIGGGYSQEEYERCKKYQAFMWKTVRGYVAEGGEFWYDMELLPNALTLWERIRYRNTEILTATGSVDPTSADQKKRWVAEKLCPNVVVNCVRTARSKAEFAAPNHILIDDKMKAIEPWVEAGGIGILHADKTIHETIARLDWLEANVNEHLGDQFP